MKKDEYSAELGDEYSAELKWKRRNNREWLDEPCILCKLERQKRIVPEFDYRSFNHRAYHAWQAFHSNDGQGINEFMRLLFRSWEGLSEERKRY